MSKVRYKFLWSLVCFVFITNRIIFVDALKFTDSGDPNVDFNPKPTNNYYHLSIDENIQNVVLFNIEEVNGAPTLTYNQVCAGFQTSNVTKDDEIYKLTLTSPIDYEAEGCHSIEATVSDKSNSISFIMAVRNLNDNDPQLLILSSSKWTMDENTPYDKSSTKCIFQMKDIDGMMEKTNFYIVAEKDNTVEDLFEASFLEEPTHEQTEAEVFVYLKQDITLDFESRNLYVFSVKAEEVVESKRSSSLQVVVNVMDMPDQPPKWTLMFTTKQFEENSDQIFSVKAVDGDAGINNVIQYEIRKNGCDGWKCDIGINSEGEIAVQGVDREDVGDTISLTLLAKEVDNSTTLDITFFITDQDDMIPSITIEGKTEGKFEFERDEGSSGIITSFTVQDMDLGKGGTYDISLKVSNDSIDYTEAFYVMPVSGYQKGDFSLTISDSSKLDYEDPDWKIITFDIVAVEQADPSHHDSKTIIINLKDINDESPIFRDKTEVASVKEDIKKGTEIFNAVADDADDGDHVSYKIEGISGQQLDISSEGIISPKVDGVFDFETQPQVFIQIIATDKANHETFKALTIKVVDVDDEPPKLTVGTDRVTVMENSKAGTVLTDAKITVTDPDSEPDLTLEIDWSSSTITKNSRVLDIDQWQCFDLSTQNLESPQTITGQLSINDKCSPDFEVFDSIIISLKATDKNTKSGNPSTTGTILINIEDENDNAPEFDDSSLAGLEVTDGNEGIVKIGVVTAHDDDIHNKVTFSISPLESQPDWVEVDEKSGLLTVKKGITIDDDIPKRDYISYNIIACDDDQLHCTPAKIDIHIKDINDNPPKITGKMENVHVDECSPTNTPLVILDYSDDDRDPPFNEAVFRFDPSIISMNAANRFQIDQKGAVSVYLKNGATLDRDHGDKEYVLPIVVYDNPKGVSQLTDTFDLKVILDDINNNSPVVLTESIECSEKSSKGETIGTIEAEDADGDGDNSNIKFEILEVTPYSSLNPKKLTIQSFDISTKDKKTAQITIKQDLRGYYGKNNLTIKTSDYGHPPMSQDNIVVLNVKKYNFEQFVFDFPKTDGDKFVLNKDQVPSSDAPLKLYNNMDLSDISIDDLQDHKWDVSFKIVDENGETPTLFRLQTQKFWTTRLLLQRQPTDEDIRKQYIVTIEAILDCDRKDSDKPISLQTHMKINFFDATEKPVFPTSSTEISFDENTTGLIQSIPQATFSSDNDLKPCYTLLDNTDTFSVDLENGDVSLKQVLDYETTSSYDLRVVASRTQTTTKDDSVLKVHVNVIDLNDHIPEFYPSKFFGAFLKAYTKQSTIVTVNAIDGDPRDANNLHFQLGEATCIGKLKPPTPPFSIGEKDGKITPNFLVTSDMSGYCTFDVQVSDNEFKHTVNHVTTSVQIHIITDDELVLFTFMNTDTQISMAQEEIRKKIDEVFQEYDYKSYLSDFNYDPDYGNTTAHFYFIEDDTQVPVKASEILGNLTDYYKFSDLKKKLGTINVFLENLSNQNDKKVVDDYLKIWLLVTSIVLATLLMLLSIAFFLRNRSLTATIRNLSTTRFGSQESGLNRAGVAAPTTNRNAVEGSNPVFNSDNYVKEVEPDTVSVFSNDSDLFGVEDNPEFQM